MDFSLNLEANAAAIRDYLSGVINPLDLRTIDSKKVLELYRTRRQNRQFADEFVPWIDKDHLILIGQSPRRITEIQPEAFFFFWNNNLYPLYTLTVWWRSAGQQDPVSLVAFLKIDSPEAEILFKTSITIILLRERRCISALDINIAAIDQEKWQKCFLWPPYEFVGDETAAKVWVHYNIHKHDPDASPEEGLEYGWARRLHLKAREAIEFFRDPNNAEKREKEVEVVKESYCGEEFTIIKNPASLLYAEFQDIFWRKHRDVWTTAKFISADLKEAPIHHDFILAILQCAWFSSQGTDCGKQLWSIESDGSTKKVRLAAKEFGSRAHLFWERMPFEYPYFYEQLFGGSSFPVDIEKFVSTAPIYEGDIKRGEEFINDLLTETISSKQWTIPFGAYVQIQFGEIKAVKLFEIGSDIACVLVNNDGEFFSVWLNLRCNELQFTQSSEIANAAGRLVRQKGLAKQIKADDPEWLSYSEEYLPRFRLGIHLLLAAIIRDFWVVENRESVFGRSFPTTKIPRLNLDHRKQSIVYLPRVRYVGDLGDRAGELNLAARKAHFVVGHLRKALHASDEQLQLARRYGILVPEGFTFVKPHRRGDEAQERIYRSRSALQCIQALESVSEPGKPDTWFQYELNVKNWLASKGFEIQYLAANKRGDGGVDIQAQKGNENLLVQCKYWLREKIGPSVIREMLGTLQTFPPGSRGVIVTCSELTEGARQLAIQNGIQFIERADFRGVMDAKF